MILTQLLIGIVVLWRSVLCDKLTEDLLTPYRAYGETCGYESCPVTKPGSLNVHIVPHTHAELGYTHNFHQHYTGEDDMYMPNQLNMERILDFVLTELWARPNRKFTLSDTTYLFHWWEKRDITVHRMVYELIRQGRLVLVGTGLISDESAASYQAVIDQATTSLRKINATFMQCGRPLVAWQAEAFGHSREFASLAAQMGFDGLFIHPISYDEEISRMRRKALEFVWRGSDDLGAESDIFTHKLFDGYWSPPGFCFGKVCSDPPLVTSDSVFANVQDRVDAFIKTALYRQAPHYGTRNIMVMMGHRFAYFDASTWFVNIEKLIDFVNQKSAEKGLNLTLFYSSPNCYLQAVHDANPVLETKQDDFYPFVYDKDSYAVGMYTSRPTLKYIVREGYVYLQIAKQMQVTANLGSNDNFFGEFSWISGVMLDHSILTGALRIPVKHYYVAKMHAAITKSTRLVSVAIRKIRNSPEYIQYHRCLFNISSCNQTRYMRYTVQIYNPLGWPVTAPVRLPVIGNTTKYTVYENGLPLKSVIVPVPYPITIIKGRPNSDHEIVFLAKNLPPIGYRTYYVEGNSSRLKRRTNKVKANKIKFIRPVQIYNYNISRINPINFDDEKIQENFDFESVENVVNASRKFAKDDKRAYIDYEYDIFKSTVAPIEDIFVHRVRKKQANVSLAKVKRDILEESIKDPIFKTAATTMATSRATTTKTTEEISLNILRTPAESQTVKPKITKSYKTKTVHTVKTTTNAPTIRRETVPGRKSKSNDGGDLYIANKYVRINLDYQKKVVGIYLCNGVNMSLNIQLYYYVSDDPKKLDRPEVRQPGVYVFRPIDPLMERMDEKYDAQIIKTEIVQEIHMTYNEWAFLIIRLYYDTPYVELNWLVGPIPIKDELGKDVFIKYSTDLANEGVFYTDSSGRQTIKRIRNMRATYEPVDFHPIAGNLYPVTSKMYIEDLKKNIRFTVFNDRCQAGGSLTEGTIDFMIHRRLLTDDIGIRAWLNETELDDLGIRVIGTHYLYVTKADYRNNRIFEKKFAKEVEMSPKVLVSTTDTIRRIQGVPYRYSNEFSALKRKLPVGVHLITLEKLPEGLLIRLENYLEKSDALKSGVKTVFLNEIFANITILSLRETALAANIYKDEIFNYQWLKKNKFYSNFNDYYGDSSNITYDDNDKVLFKDGGVVRGIKLAPQQIRTFIAQYKFNENSATKKERFPRF